MKKETFITKSPEETEALGEALSKKFVPGDIIGLVGDLGGGKTRFVRGVARGFNAKGFIKSPSFTIINIYEGGRLPLYHIDLYRIAGSGDLHSAGIEEFIYAEGVSVIEWADRLAGLLEECRYVIRFSYTGETERAIEIESGRE